MKKLLLLTLLLLAAVLAWPIYVGHQAEAYLSLPWSGQLGEWSVHQQVVTYERSNYQARIDAVLHVRGHNLEFELPLIHRVQHRMLGNQVRTEFVTDAAAFMAKPPPDSILAMLEQAAPRVETWMGLGGGFNSRIHSRAFQVERPDGRAGHLAIGQAQGGLSHSGERVLFTLDAGAFSVADSRHSLAADQLHLGILVRPGPSGRYSDWVDYDFNLSARGIDFANSREVLFAADSLQLAAWQNSTQQQLDSLIRLRAEAIDLRGLEANKLETHLTAHRLHRHALATLAREWQILYDEALPPPALRSNVLSALDRQLPLLASLEPLIQGELRFDHGSPEPLQVALEMMLDRSLAQDSLRSPWEALTIDAELKWEHSLLDAVLSAWSEPLGWDTESGAAIEAWLQAVVDQGWFTGDGGRYQAQTQLQKGRLIINDQDRSILLLALLLGFWAD